MNTTHDPIPSTESVLRDHYRKHVGASGGDGIDRERAFADAMDEVNYLIDMGEVQEPPRWQAMRNILRGIDKTDGSSADRILRKFAMGQFQLVDDEELLATVVTLGGGYRKAWEHVTATDLSAMYEERRKNFEAVKTSWEEFERNYDAVLQSVLAAGTCGIAARSGAFAGEAAA